MLYVFLSIDMPQAIAISTMWSKSALEHMLSVRNAEVECRLQMPRLVFLDLSWCKELRDSGLAEVVQLVSLQELSLAFCSQLTNSGWIFLSRLTSLTSLDLRGCGDREHLKCSTLSALHHMPHLYRLNMSNAHWHPGALTPLADVSTITQLALSDCSCWTSIDLAAVCCMRRIRDLDLQGCHLLYGVWV